MNRGIHWTRALATLSVVLVALMVVLTGGVKIAFAWTAPTLDGYLDDVYLQYGQVTRYGDTNIHTPTGLDHYAAAYLYVLEDANYVYVYYHQDMFYANDTSYGTNSIHWEVRPSGIRNFSDIYLSDRGEFTFEDAVGGVAGHFYVDQISPSAGTPSGYECLEDSGGDGAWLDGYADPIYFEMSSSMDYNLNSTGYCSGGSCSCGTGATQVDLLTLSPFASGSYVITDPDCAAWTWHNGWEFRVDKRAFGALGFGVVIGNHHNSPTKTCQKNKDCPTDLYLAYSSIGDRVWYDLDGDGMQDVGEPGLAGVTVNLIDPRDGHTIESQTTTGETGHYLFEQLSHMYYIVQVDESTLPPGFASTTAVPDPDPDDYHPTYDNVVCGDDCIARDGLTYTRIYYIKLNHPEDYETADFGYRPSGAAIGDFVWSDADSDGRQDDGEPGIGGVLMELLDSAGNPLSPPVTTTTSISGWYLFSGLTAGQYKVRVADSNFDAGGPLEGYTHIIGAESRPSPTNVITLAAEQVYVNADFGYHKDGLGSIGDYVWFDADNDGSQDAGEDGAANVTLDLYIDSNEDGALDPGEPFVAGATTNASGYYSFTGLTLDQHYLVTVTDSNGVLDGFTITTYWGDDPGEPDLDRYNDPCPVELTAADPDADWADFGYNRPGSIGDTVWLDWNENGVRDPGELGVGGVTVNLSGDASDITTTAADGTYLFTELPSGTYNVTITIPAGYSLSINPATSQPWTPNPQTGISIVGNDAYLDADFALYRDDLYTIGDTVWYDTDADGHRDAGEEGIADVTLELYRDTDGDGVQDPTEPLLHTATTDANGLYLFQGLTADHYLVIVTDENNVLDGHTLTDGVDDTNDESQDQPYAVSTNPQSVDYADFGFEGPTRVFLTSFSAYEDSGQVVVEWETASEIGTLGFYLDRLDEDTGKYVRINEQLLPGLLDSSQGGTYQYVDEAARPGETYTYRLVEVEAKGKRCRYGPFTVTVGEPGIGFSQGDFTQSASELISSGYTRKAHEISFAKRARLEAAKEAKKLAKALKKKRKGPAAKIAVTEDGLYYLSASEIASVLGASANEVQNWIKNANLRLANQGRTVAYLSSGANAGIYFYGEAIDSIYTDENVYWLKKGTGSRMPVIRGKGPSPVNSDQTFTENIHVEEDHWAAPAFFDDPEVDYWLWDYVVSGNKTLGSERFILRTDGASSTGAASVVAHLQGGSDTECSPEEHHAVVSMNGVPIGEAYWDGTSAYELVMDFDQSLLSDGGNLVEVKGLLDTCAPYSVFYVDSFDVSYQRHYRAVNNKLLVRGDGNPTVTIEGYSDPKIFVFEVTNATTPKLVAATTVDHANGSYRVSFRPASPDGLYLAMTLDAWSAPESVMADKASYLKQTRNRADYLVITPAELKGAAQELADYRQGQGLRTMVVELEDIYDEFNHGISSPHAIKDFLSYGYHHWNKSPWYVVLTGEGTFDYKDNQGYGENLMPPLIASTPHGLFAADNRFADVEGTDGVPEMAIGRLPVVTAEELTAVIAKIIAYESSSGGGWANKVLMVADNPDKAGDFPADSDDVAGLLPAEYTPEKIYLSEHSIRDARQRVLDGINGGAVLLNYIGHAGLDRLATEGMLLTRDVNTLINGDRLHVMTAMTCMVGRFSLPGYDVLGEALLLKADGGAAAVWAPTGFSLNSEAKILDEGFFSSAFQDGEKVLGEVVLRALEAYGARGDARFMLDIYILLGDPALEMK